MICARALRRSLLRLPDFLEVGVLLAELAQLLVERLETLLRRLVLLLLERLALHLELDDAAVEPVHFLRLGVHLHADARRGLVDQVDRLVGQLPVGDVAMRERGRGDDRRVRDLDLVVDRVALLQAAQDRDRVFDRRLVDQHLLEAALERGVLLDVLAVFVERGGADAMQFAARERGLQHVAGVHRAFGLAGADHRVQFVDEQDDAAFLLGEVVQHALEALLEFAAELRARDQRAHVEREDALVAQALGHFLVDDAQREAFDDRGLADARLADQHGVVLGATLQHLDRAADLVVTADDRIELALLRALGEVDRVFLEGAPLLLDVGIVDLAAAADLVDRALDRGLLHARVLEDPGERALVFEGGQDEELAGDVLVTALLRDLVGEVQQPPEVVRQVHLAARAFHLRQSVERFTQLRAQRVDVGSALVEQRPHGAALLVQQGLHEVHGLDDLVVAPQGKRLRFLQRGLELGREFVLAHGGLCPWDGMRPEVGPEPRYKRG